MTAWVDNPIIAFLRYYYKWAPVAFLLSVAAVLIPKYLLTAFTAPASATFTRADDPRIKVAVRSPAQADGGLSPPQDAAMRDVLNKLPAAHLTGVKFIGFGRNSDLPSAFGSTAAAVADPPGTIVFASEYSGPAWAVQAYLLHEIGHQVLRYTVTSRSADYWTHLHNRALKQMNFDAYPSSYWKHNYHEDFAETYRMWGLGSWGMEYAAVSSVLQTRDTALLEKFLFMAGLFMNSDHTVSFYGTEPFGFDPDNPAFVPEFSPLTVERVPYYLTSRTFTLGAYTFRMNRTMITTIEDRSGNVIADHLALMIPPTLMEKWKPTPPPPPGGSGGGGIVIRETVTANDPPFAEGNAVEGLNKPVGSTRVEIVSPELPTTYTSLLSPGGYAALAGEQAMIANPNRFPTYRDQIRPHGDYQAGPPNVR